MYVSWFGTYVSNFGIYVPNFGTKTSPQRKNFFTTVLQQFKHYVSTFVQVLVKIHEKLRRKEGLFPCLFALGGRKVLHGSLQPKKPFFCYHFFLRRKRDHRDDRLNCHRIQQRSVQVKYDKFLHFVNKGQWPFRMIPPSNPCDR